VEIEMIKLVALAALSLFASCVGPQVKKLPMYDACMALQPVGEMRSVRASEVSADQLPAMIPYAMITIDGAAASGDCERVVELAAQKLNPDLVYLGDTSTYASGSAGAAGFSRGVALAFAVPTYAHGLAAVCYRLAPVKVGVTPDPTGMVIAIDDGARKSGIIEGDHVVSFDGSPILVGTDYTKSPHLRKMLEHKPGDEITGVWIRPGAGRMEGKFTCLPNPPIHLALSDARKERENEDAARQPMHADSY
jgi:hypothetical protein